MTDATSFSSTFRALTGHSPFPWQQQLYSRLVAGELPSHCDVPTGLGKTSVIAVWLATLGEELSRPDTAHLIPRRLVYVVDRRVVVDQATEEVERLRRTLLAAEDDSGPLGRLHAVLTNASVLADEAGVAVSTLRGQFADNHAWHLDPSRPAIIVGTVDMIGSRMLFSGYGGVGRNWRSLQAGLLAQDTWIVLDEAHLIPAFEFMLGGLAVQNTRRPLLRPFGVTSMSATLSSEADILGKSVSTSEPLFSDADIDDKRVWKRISAPKALRFVVAEGAAAATKPAEQRAALAEKMASEAIALAKSSRPVVVFATAVDLVKAITKALVKALPANLQNRVLMLTGEMRGWEREKLKSNDILAAFCPDRPRETDSQAAFLVATACIEVGMDFDADHAVCDVVPLERMIQRFGRVNRRGEAKSEIRVVTTIQSTNSAPADTDEISPAAATHHVLHHLPLIDGAFDASPAAIRGLDLTSAIAKRAYTPAPVSPVLDEARLDDWSLTSLKADEFPRPQVNYWLRGVTEDDSVTTSLVWRAELSLDVSNEAARELIDIIPVSPREIAQVATYRAAELLAALAKKVPSSRVIVRTAAGEVRVTPLTEYLDAKRKIGALAFTTVFIPSRLGGLLSGTPDGSTEALSEGVHDVVNAETPKSDTHLESVSQSQWIRAVLSSNGEAIQTSLIQSEGGLKPLGEFTDESEALAAIIQHLHEEYPGMLVRRERVIDDIVPSVVDGQNTESTRHAIAYFHITNDPSLSTSEEARSLLRQPVTLSEHTRVTEAVASALAKRLGLSTELQEAVSLAARWHDKGKDRRCWQAAIGNSGSEPLAKSDQPFFDYSKTAGYRHEFGSLMDALDADELNQHPQRDLILHLIAAHHGHARPFFRRNAFDWDTPFPLCEQAAAEVPGRFAKLQRDYGWWQLAWLEALVKCADAIASAYPQWPSK